MCTQTHICATHICTLSLIHARTDAHTHVCTHIHPHTNTQHTYTNMVYKILFTKRCMTSFFYINVSSEQLTSDLDDKSMAAS